MDLTEGVGESSSPPRSFISFNNYDVRSDVYNRLVESGHEEALSQPEFRDQLDAHFNRLPARYSNSVAAFQYLISSFFLFSFLMSFDSCFVYEISFRMLELITKSYFVLTYESS
jgi:hypothetical protein